MIKKIFLYLAAIFYIFAGTLHFVNPEPYLKIMPPYIPWHLAMIYVSGAGEIAGGLGLLIPVLRRSAAWGLVALLIAVLPANIYMATAQIQPMSVVIPPVLLWLRIPIQGVLIWWVLWCTQPQRTDNPAAGPV
jgi:uncharacterized membrane protein